MYISSGVVSNLIFLSRSLGTPQKASRYTDAIVGGEIVAKGTQPWIGVIGSARFPDTTKGRYIP